jgi:dihydrofolate reductase
MGRLMYSLTTSIDGYVSDKDGNFEWTKPSEEVLACVNGILHNVGTFLLGRSMYETLAVWDTIPTDGQSDGMNDFAKIWRAAKKIVYSTSLSDVATTDTTIERVFNSEAIQKVVSESDRDFNIGGPHLAAEAIKAGIVDEHHQFIVPLTDEQAVAKLRQCGDLLSRIDQSSRGIYYQLSEAELAEMDCPAILKTSRPGVPGRVDGAFCSGPMQSSQREKKYILATMLPKQSWWAPVLCKFQRVACSAPDPLSGSPRGHPHVMDRKAVTDEWSRDRPR